MTKLPVSQSTGERLTEFMRKIASQTYPEPITEMHSEITRKVLAELIPKLPKGAEVLDVGCGQGPALNIFKEHNIQATGITLNHDDWIACMNRNFYVMEMDQNAMEFDRSMFHLVYARHVLEHSIAPLWTLTEFWRVLKPGGLLYAEMPAPDTDCAHEVNVNHYSVLGQRAWYELLHKAGFAIEEAQSISIQTMAGPDVYFSFTCRKVQP